MDQATITALSERAEAAARDYFRQGLNCAECVMRSFLDLGLTDLPEEIIAMASGLGGGIGMTRNNCGAVLGGALAIGTMQGRKDPFAKESFQERVEELNGENGIYQLFRRYVESLEAQYGTIVCRDMNKGMDWEGKPRKKSCQAIIGHCAGLAVKYALEDREGKPNT